MSLFLRIKKILCTVQFTKKHEKEITVLSRNNTHLSYRINTSRDESEKSLSASLLIYT